MFLTAITSMPDSDDKEFLLNLYHRFYPITYKTINKLLGTDDETEDIVNETFIKLIGKTSLLKSLSDSQLICYVVTAARHTAINFINKRKAFNKHCYLTDDFMNIPASETDTPEQLLIAENTLADLAKIITELPESAQDILMWKYLLQKSCQEIAATLNISEQTVWQRLHRAKQLARKKLVQKRGEQNER